LRSAGKAATEPFSAKRERPPLKKKELIFPVLGAKVLHLDGLMIQASVERRGKQGRGFEWSWMQEPCVKILELVSQVDVLIASARFAVPLGEDCRPKKRSKPYHASALGDRDHPRQQGEPG